MTKYLPLIQIINNHLNEFNSFLLPEFKIQLLDLDELKNDNYFLTLEGKKWNNFVFPRNREVGGIYFYFGCAENDDQTIGVYIGKASLSSTIGMRLYSHFKPRFDKNNFIQHYYDIPFKLEMITSIPIDNTEMTFLAPSLEEFLINKIQAQNYRLFNTQGNYQ